MMNRYMHETGTTEETFATFAEIQRVVRRCSTRRAAEGPAHRGATISPLPYITKPLRLLDCDYPCDSGSAVIFTTEERARDLRQPAVFVEASALSAIHDMNFEIMPDMVRTAPRTAASCCGLGPISSRRMSTPPTCTTGSASSRSNGSKASGCARPGRPARSSRRAIPASAATADQHRRRRHQRRPPPRCQLLHRSRPPAPRPVRRPPSPDAEVSVWANAVGPFAGAMLLTKG